MIYVALSGAARTHARLSWRVCWLSYAPRCSSTSTPARTAAARSKSTEHARPPGSGCNRRIGPEAWQVSLRAAVRKNASSHIWPRPRPAGARVQRCARARRAGRLHEGQRVQAGGHAIHQGLQDLQVSVAVLASPHSGTPGSHSPVGGPWRPRVRAHRLHAIHTSMRLRCALAGGTRIAAASRRCSPTPSTSTRAGRWCWTRCSRSRTSRTPRSPSAARAARYAPRYAHQAPHGHAPTARRHKPPRGSGRSPRQLGADAHRGRVVARRAFAAAAP